MKTEDIKETTMLSVTIDPSLNELEEQVFFPEKLAKANEMLKTANLPYRKHQLK